MKWLHADTGSTGYGPGTAAGGVSRRRHAVGGEGAILPGIGPVGRRPSVYRHERSSPDEPAWDAPALAPPAGRTRTRVMGLQGGSVRIIHRST